MGSAEFTAIILLILLLFGFLTIDLSFQALAGILSWTAVLIPFLLAMYSALVLIGLARSPVRTAKFFEDRIRLTGAGTNIDCPYSDVTEISKIVKTSLGRRRTDLLLRIRGETRTFPLRNPTITTMNIDLYSLIVEKSGLQRIGPFTWATSRAEDR
jgi:hypothetical protein